MRERITDGDTNTDKSKGFWADERGAAFVEFIIALYAFLFVLLGVVQVGLMVCSSLYVNYGNYMALRTAAAVWQEPKEDGLISQSEFNDKCLGAALHALGPVERYHWKHPFDGSAKSNAQSRLHFTCNPTSDQFDGKAKGLTGKLEYDCPMIVPFVGRVISALAKHTGQPSAEQENRVGQNFAYDTSAMDRYPTVTLRSNNDLGQGGLPRPHPVTIQRRWKYSLMQD